MIRDILNSIAKFLRAKEMKGDHKGFYVGYSVSFLNGENKMSFFKKLNPVTWIKNKFLKNILGSVLRKLIAGAGVAIIALGTVAGVEQEGKEIAELITTNQEVILAYISGAALFVLGTGWSLINKFKDK